MDSFNLRVGIGYDVHRFELGAPLWIGGVLVPHHSGSIGHSDADVLIHAICDALLGAANLRDIGYHFSDQDPAFKGIDSKILLRKVCEMLNEKSYKIINIDSVVALQAPKLMHVLPQMQACLAQTMQIAQDQITIKATTTEKLGFVGTQEGIEARAVALIVKS